MILESIVTTVDNNGHINLAPLGPIIHSSESPHDAATFLMRPYEGSRTCANLLANGCAVIHVVDDALLIARSAIGRVEATDRVMPVEGLETTHFRLIDCHRWYAIRVTEKSGIPPRHELNAITIAEGTVRPFFGFNRAKHAIIEAAISATRLQFLPAEDVADDLRRAAVAVEKTGGPDEREALRLIERHVMESAVK